MPWIRTTVCASALMSASPSCHGDPCRQLSHSAERQCQPDVRTAAGPVLRVSVAAVGTSDRLDDRKAEAAPVGTRRIGATEALERVRKEPGRKTRAGVQHVQFDGAV